jgi:5-dehydro-4-deoxyglucarate dehydratase
MKFDGVLFFPITPFDARDRVASDMLNAHIAAALAHAPGAVFPACGTGEYHALSASEATEVVATTVQTVGGAVPVVAGAGGPLGHAVEVARAAAEAGADALLVLPPYLVSAPQEGLLAYVRAIADASELPVVVYHRANARFSLDSVRRLADDPRVIGFKDGVGDVGLAQLISRVFAAAGRDDVALFNGLLTAELTQAAYRAVGVPLYSSAVFAMAPDIATAYYRAYSAHDEERRLALLDGFYTPLVRLRDTTPGFAVSLIKAGVRRSGLAVGGVRAPLTDPDADQERALAELLETGRALL